MAKSGLWASGSGNQAGQNARVPLDLDREVAEGLRLDLAAEQYREHGEGHPQSPVARDDPVQPALVPHDPTLGITHHGGAERTDEAARGGVAVVGVGERAPQPAV